MRVLASFGTGINSANNRYYQTVQVNQSLTLPDKNTAKSKRKIIYKSTGIAVTAASLAAAGICLVRRKPQPRTFLPDNLLTQSMPDFLKKELSKNKNYEKFIQAIEHPENNPISGKGANSTVYNLPFLDEYVLKILNKHTNRPIEVPLNIFPDDINLGQPVWIHPENFKIILLKKVEGEPHSIKDWSDTIWDNKIRCARSVTKEQTADYYNKVTRIADMDQSVFDDLAMQIKTLDLTRKSDDDILIGFKTDSINPNNLLVDIKNNKLNIIDYFAKTKPQHQNSYMDMVSVISDFTLFPEYYDWLLPQYQQKLLHAIKTIDQKSYKAAVKVGLDTDEKTFVNFVNYTDKYFKVPGVPKRDGSGDYVRQYAISANNMLNLLRSIRNNPQI